MPACGKVVSKNNENFKKKTSPVRHVDIIKTHFVHEMIN